MKTNTIKFNSCLIVLAAALLVSIGNLKAQNVGIGGSSFIPNSSAMLDVSSTTKGMLIPRMTQTQRNAIASPAAGLLVYDNSFSQFYYYDGSAWRPLLANNTGWGVNGNSGTVAPANFLGTTDYQGLSIKTNNTERIRVKADGDVGIGTASPSAKLEVLNSLNSTGTIIHNSLTSNANEALHVINGGTGDGIYVEATHSEATGIICSQGGVMPDINSFISTTGGASGTGYSIGLGNGRGLFAGGQNIGVEGSSYGDGVASSDELSGIFYVQNSSNLTTAIAAVGSVVDNTVYKILGNGIVSTIVNDLNEKPVVMAAPEAPEALFQDFGTGQLVNGKVHIMLDPILSKNITVDENHPIKVFIQLNDDCNGVFVKNKDGNGFDVEELKSGTSNAKFSWMLTATRKNETRGGVTSDYENFRFKRTYSPAFNNIPVAKNQTTIMDIK